jgi:hypothetical protein
MTFGGGAFSCIGFKFAQLELSPSLRHHRMGVILMCLVIEVVLALLIERFSFSPADKQIRWNMAPIQVSRLGCNRWFRLRGVIVPHGRWTQWTAHAFTDEPNIRKHDSENETATTALKITHACNIWTMCFTCQILTMFISVSPCTIIGAATRSLEAPSLTHSLMY